MKKRWVSLLTTAILTVTTLASVMTVGAKDVKDFQDVKSSDWFYSYVEDVAERNIMTGLNATTFGVSNSLERGQFVTVLYRMADSPKTTYSNKFPDVSNGIFYSLPVIWANELGVVTGYDNKYFGPQDKITREQLATMLFRYAGKCDINTGARADLSGFPDGKKVSAFARDAMEWAVYVGIIKGNEDGTLAPQDNVSRAVCATMISRFISEPQGPQYDSYNADTYTVGTDIPAGEYVLVRDGDQMGMVQLAADEGGITDDFIVYTEFYNTYILTIEDGQEITFSGCTAYPIGKEGQINTSESGMYKVGTHIPAGTYTIREVGDCYYEITTDSKHTDASVVEKGNIASEKVVTVKDGQYLEIINGEIVK